jgi:hypothetical protein
MKLSNRIVLALSAIVVAFASAGARAATLHDLVFDGSFSNNGDPIWTAPDVPIFFEDEFGSSVVQDDGGQLYILGVVDIQAIKRGQFAIGDDLGGGTTAGIQNIPKQGVPSVSVQGAGSSLTAIVFGILEEIAPGVFVLEPVNGARTVFTSKGDVVNVGAFSNDALVQVYYQEITENLGLSDASDDVANVTNGNLIGEFGFTGSGNEFYNILSVGGQIAGFELSLNLIGPNNSGLALGVSDLGTHLYGKELGLDENVAPTGWDVLDDGDFKIVVVPTPAALPAGLAILGLAALRRRRA